MTFYKWSRTAATNATADSFTWAEGQAPSSVNDSARGMMAAAAKYRDDTAGSIVTGGTSTAYTLATFQSFPSLALLNGAQLGFVPHTTCTGPVTLAVDGLPAQAVRRVFGVALAAGDLMVGSVYIVTFITADGAFYLNTPQPPFPSGTLMLFQQTSAPVLWTKQATHNDKTLRVVSGTASSGGSSPFSTVFGLTATNSYALLTNDIPSHNHTATDSGHTHSESAATASNSFAAGAGSGLLLASATTGVGTANITVGNTGGGAGHSHGIELRVQYVDLIIASKD